MFHAVHQGAARGYHHCTAHLRANSTGQAAIAHTTLEMNHPMRSTNHSSQRSCGAERVNAWARAWDWVKQNPERRREGPCRRTFKTSQRRSRRAPRRRSRNAHLEQANRASASRQREAQHSETKPEPPSWGTASPAQHGVAGSPMATTNIVEMPSPDISNSLSNHELTGDVNPLCLLLRKRKPASAFDG